MSKPEMKIVRTAALDWQKQVDHEPFVQRRKALGGSRISAGLWELPAGKKSFPFHAHQGTEEAMFVVAGTAKLRTPEGLTKLSAGDYVSFPPGARPTNCSTTATRRSSTSVSRPRSAWTLSNTRTLGSWPARWVGLRAGSASSSMETPRSTIGKGRNKGCRRKATTPRRVQAPSGERFPCPLPACVERSRCAAASFNPRQPFKSCQKTKAPLRCRGEACVKQGGALFAPPGRMAPGGHRKRTELSWCTENHVVTRSVRTGETVPRSS